jgi:hypothetical protein
MAPPSKRIKLSEIEPEYFAKEVCVKVISHINKQLQQIRPFNKRIYFNQDDVASNSYLGDVASRLAKYAKYGTETGLALNSVEDLTAALYASPTMEYDSVSLYRSCMYDLDTTWGVVIVAAIARNKLSGYHRITSRELATLASLSQRQIQSLSADGTLEITKQGNYSTDVARRFLAERGVPGF